MKILILANFDGGLYLFRKELIGELLKEHEVFISLPYGERVPQLEEMGCQFIESHVDRRGINPIEDFKLILEYFGLIKNIKPDFVITYTIKPNIYGGYACMKKKIPYAANITGLGTAFQKAGMVRTLVKTIYRVGLKKAKVVFFENSENRKTLIEEKIIDSRQAKLLAGAGVNLEHFDYRPYPENEKTKFIFIGRVMKEKGVDELLAVMKRLISEGWNCELDILGFYEENYEDEIKECQKSGWLNYLGFQKDVRPFVQAADCFVLPSWHEGMANTNLESAALGRPIITSNISGCKEAAIDGVSGFLCEKQDSESLYRVMKKFLDLSNSQREVMGKEGRMHMERLFDKKIVVAETIAEILR